MVSLKSQSCFQQAGLGLLVYCQCSGSQRVCLIRVYLAALYSALAWPATPCVLHLRHPGRLMKAVPLALNLARMAVEMFLAWKLMLICFFFEQMRGAKLREWPLHRHSDDRRRTHIQSGWRMSRSRSATCRCSRSTYIGHTLSNCALRIILV